MLRTYFSFLKYVVMGMLLGLLLAGPVLAIVGLISGAITIKAAMVLTIMSPFIIVTAIIQSPIAILQLVGTTAATTLILAYISKWIDVRSKLGIISVAIGYTALIAIPSVASSFSLVPILEYVDFGWANVFIIPVAVTLTTILCMWFGEIAFPLVILGVFQANCKFVELIRSPDAKILKGIRKGLRSNTDSSDSEGNAESLYSKDGKATCKRAGFRQPATV